ncbi:hypothetical protein [Nocardia sp. XZ_19_231]|uniref:hypothetical protein n=1 Tax=Nocardia sp. XZ_19_231 TaxID=2769252 RepID=UPI00188EF3CF|nr:hypothetical protein [Nocardia sp. XZ_19_231]
MAIDPAIAALLGTLLGVVSTILTSRATTKAAERKDIRARQAELRKERREAAHAFNEIYKELEEHLASGGERDRTLIRRMWFAHNKLAYVAGDELQVATTELADQLNVMFWSSEPWTNGRFYDSLLPVNRKFQAAVRSDLREE